MFTLRTLVLSISTALLFVPAGCNTHHSDKTHSTQTSAAGHGAHDAHAAGVAPDDAMKKLVAGNERFASGRNVGARHVVERRSETAQSQHPFAIIITCADSRVGPELVFDQNVGDLFVVRTAGNLVDDHALGSIEYAVEHLGARLIVVMGHERCGAVKAALGSSTAPGHVNSLVRDIQPAVLAAKGKPGDPLSATIEENAKLVAQQIRSQAHLGELAGQTQVMVGVYDLDTGVVSWVK